MSNAYSNGKTPVKEAAMYVASVLTIGDCCQADTQYQANIDLSNGLIGNLI